MWLCNIGDSNSRFTSTEINDGSGIWFKSGKDTRVNIDSNIKTELQNWDRGHIHIRVQFHWSDKLSICQKFGSGQVQDGLMKLNLG